MSEADESPEAVRRGQLFRNAARDGRPLPDGTGISLREVRLDGLLLKKAILRRANLGGASFKEAILDEAVLDGANLIGAELAGASLVRVSAVGVDLGGANLRQANLQYADLRQANLEDTDLRGADLSGAFLPLAEPGLPYVAGARLSKLTLDRSEFGHFDIEWYYRAGARFDDDAVDRSTWPSRPSVDLLVLPMALPGLSREQLSYLPGMALGWSTSVRLTGFESYARHSVIWLEGLDVTERRRFLAWLLQPYDADGLTRLEKLVRARLAGASGGGREQRLLGVLELFDTQQLQTLLTSFGEHDLLAEATGHRAMVDGVVSGLDRRLGPEGMPAFVAHLVRELGPSGEALRAHLEGGDDGANGR